MSVAGIDTEQAHGHVRAGVGFDLHAASMMAVLVGAVDVAHPYMSEFMPEGVQLVQRRATLVDEDALGEGVCVAVSGAGVSDLHPVALIGRQAHEAIPDVLGCVSLQVLSLGEVGTDRR